MEDVTIVTEFMQYGILGIVCLTLAYFAKTQWQRIEAKNQALEKKIDNLQKDIMNVLTDDRDRFAELVQKNTEAMQELSRIVLEYIVNK